MGFAATGEMPDGTGRSLLFSFPGCTTCQPTSVTLGSEITPPLMTIKRAGTSTARTNRALPRAHGR